ncbi:hypothetical protein Tco_0179499 [Tanacetum coccineum]|uniref:Uncharacterized protein n=1 Tax=Tanacetum coccineum TaxID=301880 RepID=A0ABQ5BXN3_9ASTR
MCCGSPLWLVDSVVMVWRRGVVRYGGFVCGVCCQIRVIGCEMWCFWGRGSCGHLGCVGGLGGGEGSGCGLRYVEDVRKSVCFGIKFSSGDALAVVRTGCSGCLEGESGLWVSGGRAGGVYGYGVVDVVAFSGCVGSCSLARSALKGGHLDMSLRAGVGKGMSLEGGEGCGGNWIRAKCDDIGVRVWGVGWWERDGALDVAEGVVGEVPAGKESGGGCVAVCVFFCVVPISPLRERPDRCALPNSDFAVLSKDWRVVVVDEGGETDGSLG